MDKYIKAVLAADGKVIIPRFGCIIEPSEEPGTLSFNPYLNFDDGKLTAAISAGENLDEQNASYKISDTVDDYNNRLSDGETVSINGIGSFKKDEDGRVEFTQSPDFVHGDGDISLGMGMKVEDNIAPEPAAEPEPVAEPEPEATTQPETEEEKPVQEPEQAAAPTEVDAKEEEKPAEVEEAKKDDEPETVVYYEEEKKRRWPLVLLIIILLLIIIWLLLFVFFKDNAVYRYFCGNATPVQTEQVAPAPADTTAVEDTIVAPAPVIKEKPAKKAPTEARALDHRYNVIVGSYKEEGVAINRVKELHDMGYEDAFVGIKKEYYVAVIKDFSSLTQAEAYQEEIVDGPDHIESWITNSGENE